MLKVLMFSQSELSVFNLIKKNNALWKKQIYSTLENSLELSDLMHILEGKINFSQKLNEKKGFKIFNWYVNRVIFLFFKIFRRFFKRYNKIEKMRKNWLLFHLAFPHF